MNRDRLIEINNFLTQFKEELKNKPEKSESICSKSNIYYHLVRYNTKKNCDNSDLFDYWVNNNSRENTNVFVASNWQYFCQFKSHEEKLADSTKHHKIYLSLEDEYMKDGVNRLFDFLDRENIPHISKVGKKSRDDQIVVRVSSHEDCEKVVNFINNDSYIQEGKKKANLFSYQQNGVALAADGEVSYNDCISKTIRLYLNNMVEANKVDEINVNSFVDFCVDYYNKYFIKKEDINKVLTDFNVDDSYYLSDIVDYEYCIKLFLNGINKNFNISKYSEFIDEKQKKADLELEEFSNSLNVDTYIELFNELCNVMLNKYGYHNGSWQIKEFIDTGDKNYITRDNNLRNRVSNASFIKFIFNYAKNRGVTIDDLINSFYQKSSSSMFDDENSELLKKGINTTFTYHQQLYEIGQDSAPGYEYAKSAIVRLLRDKKYNGFTRRNNIRLEVENKISRDTAFNIVMKELGLTNIDNLNLYDVVDKYLDKILKFESEKTI